MTMRPLKLSVVKLFIFQLVLFFKFLDKNQDNFLSKGEASQFLRNNRSISLENNSWFLMMDQNNDGRISPNEFDEELNVHDFKSFRNQHFYYFLIFKNCTFKTIQWKPFNVIPLVQVQTDNINKMIITTNLLYF